MTTGNLERLIEQVEAYAAFSRPPVHSFLALIGGAPVAECYWWGHAATSHQPVYSVTKSVVSALVGIALGDGLLNLSDTLGTWFPELAPAAAPAPVTITHLLTMTGGFAPLPQAVPAAVWRQAQ